MTAYRVTVLSYQSPLDGRLVDVPVGAAVVDAENRVRVRFIQSDEAESWQEHLAAVTTVEDLDRAIQAAASANLTTKTSQREWTGSLFDLLNRVEDEVMTEWLSTSPEE